MRKIAILFAAAFAMVSVAASGAKKSNVISSPDGRISVELTTAGTLGYTVKLDGKLVYTLSDISVNLADKTIPAAPVKLTGIKHVTNSFSPAVPLKFSTIKEDYNEATLSLGNGCTMLIRVMNNAVAYRIVLKEKGDIQVMDDHFRLTPADGFVANYQAPGSFNTAYEESYQTSSLLDWSNAERRMATIPLLLSKSKNDSQLLIGESDVDDYPRQFLTTDGSAIMPTYPKSPVKWEPRGDRGETIVEEGPAIARTVGSRALPWRWVAVTDSKGIIEQTIPVQLARRSALDDESWIEPGQVSWEWWNGATPFGPDVDFKAGCNYETYCYFADFAAKFGIKYILLDEGWAKSTRDPFHGNDELRLPELIKYCNSKGVKIILWLPWLTAYQNLDKLFKTYAEWGIPAVKIDFMDHADQWMVNFYKRVTAEAAKYHIIVDWHGAFSPAGLEYEYPNLISYEGVLGLEQMGGCVPKNTLFIPFIRNAVGAADFTPGGMNNMQPKQYSARRPNSGAQGTRCFQMALYVILESGIQMLADNPTRYYQNEDCTRFIASVPTTWDETRALEAKAGEYVVVAKRKGNKWFIGAITNDNARDFKLNLDFLAGGEHRLTAYKDGLNAGYQAMHYNKVEQTVTSATTLDIHLERNGGWAAVIE
ncbi:MAG: glycoside hydrolase family 97 catalytic domain-containing protein [Bacteroidaceae bacterium]|nr:glycoside hydrolase family 97 catalytic domain-containing protein [Bacteroidaceae bacterium]